MYRDGRDGDESIVHVARHGEDFGLGHGGQVEKGELDVGAERLEERRRGVEDGLEEGELGEVVVDVGEEGLGAFLLLALAAIQTHGLDVVDEARVHPAEITLLGL